MSAEPRSPGIDEQSQQKRHLKALPTVEPSETAETKPRNRKALVSRPQRSRSRGTVVLAFLLIPVALVVILLLNILMASHQYDLVSLKAEQKSLTQQNEAIAQEIQFYQAPQDLAARATSLGMFASTSSASLNLQTGKIEGTPAPAVSPSARASNAPASVVIAPPVLTDTNAYAQAQKTAKPKASASPSATASAHPSESAGH